MCCCSYLLFLVRNTATLVLVVSSTASIFNEKDSSYSLFVEPAYGDDSNDGGFLFNQDFPSFDNNNNDAFRNGDTGTTLSNANEDIFIDFPMGTVSSSGCSPALPAPLSRIKLRTRQPSEQVCPNNDNPLQKPASDTDSVRKSEQENWCSKSVMTGFGNIPVCEEQPFNTIISEVTANPHASSPLPEPAGFVTLLECFLLSEYEAEHGQPCPRDHVFCCNAYLPGQPSEPATPEAQDGGVAVERDAAGWGYWCWPSDQSWMFQGPPPDWSEIMKTFGNPLGGL